MDVVCVLEGPKYHCQDGAMGVRNKSGREGWQLGPYMDIDIQRHPTSSWP